MISDLNAARLTATGTVSPRRSRVKAVYCVATATAGTIELKDGGSGGTSKITLDTPGAGSEHVEFNIPEEGILFKNDVHATLTNVASITVVYA